MIVTLYLYIQYNIYLLYILMYLYTFFIAIPFLNSLWQLSLKKKEMKQEKIGLYNNFWEKKHKLKTTNKLLFS